MDPLNSRVFILNGQPFIIQQNNNINSISNISEDILQNALQEVDSSPSDSVHTQVDSEQFIQAVQNTENCVDELVAYKQGNGDEPSTIHLTVEQAVELGIEFNVCGVDLPTNTFPTGEKVINKDQFIFSKDPSENICLFSTGASDTTNVGNTTFDHTEPSGSDDISKLKLDSNIIEQLNDSVNPQLTLIPQIHNGTITYTLQVDSNTETNQLSTNNLSTSKDSVHMLPIETSVANTTFDLSNLTTTSSAPTLSTLAMPPMSLSIADNSNHNRNQSVSFIASSNNILPETADILSTESENAIHDNLVVYQHEPLPQMMESDILAGNNHRFVRLNTNSKPSMNSSTKNPTTLFMSGPPPLDPISTKSSSPSQPVRSKTSTSNSFQLSADQMNKVQTLISPEGRENVNKQVPIRPSMLPNGIPKEVSKVVARYQTADAGEKIGSNKNPIQLIQQGKTFTSVQSLSQHQLRHVAAVLTKNNFDIAQTQFDKNVIFDKKTNTRIIYRMIYPEDLDLKEASDGNEVSSTVVGAAGGKKRGRPLKSKPGEGGEAPSEPPRKKLPLPRTRSGRLSRPPRHIVRDYKRIRRLDNDDMEQDGSFSDYQTDDQDDTPADPVVDNQLLPGLAATKKRRISSSFRCPSCTKVYLGIHKMENHFFKYPDHRPPPPPADQQSAATPQANSGVAGGVEKPGGVAGGGGGTSREGLAQQRGGSNNSSNSLSKKKFKRRSGSVAGSSVKPDQMRAQLKQLLDLCSETELVEVVGPVLASVLSAWELLLLRVDAMSSTSTSPSPSSDAEGGRSRTRVDALCTEIKTLLTSFTQMSAALFQPVDAAATCLLDAATFEMRDLAVSSVLGIPCGVYRVDESLLNVDKILANRKTESDGGGLSDAVTHTDKPDAVVGVNAEKVGEDVSGGGGGKQPEEPVQGKSSNVPFLLGGENDEIMSCDERTALDSNLDRFVNERLQNFTSTSRDLTKSEVDELVFNALERGGVVRRQDLIEPSELSLNESFLTIGGRRPPHVSASTEDLIKSLENFVAADELPTDERTSFVAASDNFNRVDGVDALDFDVLSQNFHSSGANSQ